LQQKVEKVIGRWRSDCFELGVRAPEGARNEFDSEAGIGFENGESFFTETHFDVFDVTAGELLRERAREFDRRGGGEGWVQGILEKRGFAVVRGDRELEELTAEVEAGVADEWEKRKKHGRTVRI
jgi:hypothetical protein